MATPNAGKAERDERRQQLLQVATTLFVQKGFAATSMSAIAAAAGLQKASLYHHFCSKESLLLEAVTRGIDNTVNALERLTGNDGLSPRETLAGAMNVIYDSLVLSEVAQLAPLIAETSRLYPGMAQAFNDDFITPIHDRVSTILSLGMDAGHYRRLDIEATIDVMVGPAVSLAMHRAMFASFDDVCERFDVQQSRDAHLLLLERLLLVDHRA